MFRIARENLILVYKNSIVEDDFYGFYIETARIIVTGMESISRDLALSFSAKSLFLFLENADRHSL